MISHVHWHIIGDGALFHVDTRRALAPEGVQRRHLTRRPAF